MTKERYRCTLDPVSMTKKSRVTDSSSWINDQSRPKTDTQTPGAVQCISCSFTVTWYVLVTRFLGVIFLTLTSEEIVPRYVQERNF